MVVHGVDITSNKYCLLPPTASELAALAKQSREMREDFTAPETRPFFTRNLSRRLLPETIAELVARYRGGESMAKLSEEVGISKAGLRKLLLAEGVTLRKQPLTPEGCEQAVRLYHEGMSIMEVVDQLESSYGAVRRALLARGVAMRPKAPRKRVPEDARPTEQDSAEAVPGADGAS